MWGSDQVGRNGLATAHEIVFMCICASAPGIGIVSVPMRGGLGIAVRIVRGRERELGGAASGAGVRASLGSPGWPYGVNSGPYRVKSAVIAVRIERGRERELGGAGAGVRASFACPGWPYHVKSVMMSVVGGKCAR